MLKRIFNSWSPWRDVCAGKYSNTFYLLQYKRHRNGKVRFRIAKARNFWANETMYVTQLKDPNEIKVKAERE